MTRRIITGYLILTLSVIWFFFSKDTLQTQDQLSRENFFREILYAKATKNTHLFDDYIIGGFARFVSGTICFLCELFQL